MYANSIFVHRGAKVILATSPSAPAIEPLVRGLGLEGTYSVVRSVYLLVFIFTNRKINGVGSTHGSH